MNFWRSGCMDTVDVPTSETFLFTYFCRSFEEGEVSKSQQILWLQSFADPPQKKLSSQQLFYESITSLWSFQRYGKQKF